MKLLIIIFSFLSIIYSCSDHGKEPGPENRHNKFDKEKWAMQETDDFPYRDKMLEDLVANVKLKGLKKQAVLDLLGQPSRIDSNYLYYG